MEVCGRFFEGLGLNKHFISLIWHYISSSLINILWNKKCTEELHPRKGSIKETLFLPICLLFALKGCPTSFKWQLIRILGSQFIFLEMVLQLPIFALLMICLSLQRLQCNKWKLLNIVWMFLKIVFVRSSAYH